MTTYLPVVGFTTSETLPRVIRVGPDVVELAEDHVVGHERVAETLHDGQRVVFEVEERDVLSGEQFLFPREDREPGLAGLGLASHVVRLAGVQARLAVASRE